MPIMSANRRLGWLRVWALALASCASPPGPRVPPAAAAPAPACLTIRDQELACQIQCDPLAPALRACVETRRLSSGQARFFSRVWLRGRSDGQGGLEAVRVALPRSAPLALDEAGGCFAEAMRRYRYCREAPPRGTPFELPLIVSHAGEP